MKNLPYSISHIILLLLINIVSSTIYYVNPSNTNKNGNGLSWSDAFINLSDALDVAVNNDEIWLIGNEIHSPPQESPRDGCFSVNNGVSIYGGFVGHETLISQRPKDAETIISGEIGDPLTKEDNCYHVITYDTDIALDTVTIMDGYADFSINSEKENISLSNGYGAGLISIDGAKSQHVIINNVIFARNAAVNGGALYFGGSSDHVMVRITNCLFRNNKAINDGGYGGAYGGAIYIYSSPNIFISTTRFVQNYAETRGGGIYINYGAMLDCNQCDFENNRADGDGAAIFVENRGPPNEGVTAPINRRRELLQIVTTNGTDTPTLPPSPVPTIFFTTFSPTESPTSGSPTSSPTKPRKPKTSSPTESPITGSPTSTPTKAPVSRPSKSTTSSPTGEPTLEPTKSPTSSPTGEPTLEPTLEPTSSPTKPRKPTKSPTISGPTVSTTSSPTSGPTASTTSSPTKSPRTRSPTSSPTTRTRSPSPRPTPKPLSGPTTSPTSSPTGEPTLEPTLEPTFEPTLDPTGPTKSTTSSPTIAPATIPTPRPTSRPSKSTTSTPTKSPTSNPTRSTTSSPSISPIPSPSGSTTSSPTKSPISSPSTSTTFSPSTSTTFSPSTSTTFSPSTSTTFSPSTSTTFSPSKSTTSTPTKSPISGSPTLSPTKSPTANPTTTEPTTSYPTTASPTTASPTTASPTTASPTTASPTTASPTAASPTTASPTTASPTSASPTTANPTTDAPTSPTIFPITLPPNTIPTHEPTTFVPTSTSTPTLRPTSTGFVQPISCGDTFSDTYNNNETITWRFDLPFVAEVTFSSCNSDFDTVIELSRDEQFTTQSKITGCDNCGTLAHPADCSQISPGCCSSNPKASEIAIQLKPNTTYYWRLSSNEQDRTFANYQVTMNCKRLDLPTLPPNLITTLQPAATPSPTLLPTTQEPTPKPSDDNRPADNTLQPTATPFIKPSECNEYCDAYSVMVEDVYTIDEDICITYNVEKLFDFGYYCYDPIKWFVLGLCKGDNINHSSGKHGCNDNDLNGLITSFEVLSQDYSSDSYDDDDDDDDDSNKGWWKGNGSGDRRRLGKHKNKNKNKDKHKNKHHKYNKNVWGTHYDDKTGIKINMMVYDQMIFEICMINVFKVDVEFSNNVGFKRGKNKFTCYDDEWLIGLPCIDHDKFEHGSYSKSGYNYYNTYHGSANNDDYNNDDKLKLDDANNADDNDEQDQETMEIVQTFIAKWWKVLICIIALIRLCIFGVIVYCLVLRRKRLKRRGGRFGKIPTMNKEDDDYDDDDEIEDGGLTEDGLMDVTDYTVTNDIYSDNDNDIGSNVTKKKKKMKIKINDRRGGKEHKYKNINEVELQELSDISL